MLEYTLALFNSKFNENTAILILLYGIGGLSLFFQEQSNYSLSFLSHGR